MRLSGTALILLLSLLLWFTTSAQERMPLLEHRISCRIDSATVEQVLEQVVNDNELYFSYNPDVLPKGKISISLINVSDNIFFV